LFLIVGESLQSKRSYNAGLALTISLKNTPASVMKTAGNKFEMLLTSKISNEQLVCHVHYAWLVAF